MSYGEADTRAKLIDPALHARGWTEDLIRREETAGPVEIVGDRARRRPRGRIDYTLRVKVNAQSQPVAVALIEAKAEHLPPAHGLEQAKAWASRRGRCRAAQPRTPRGSQPEVIRAGGLPALKVLGEPAEVLHETKERLFAA